MASLRDAHGRPMPAAPMPQTCSARAAARRVRARRAAGGEGGRRCETGYDEGRTGALQVDERAIADATGGHTAGAGAAPHVSRGRPGGAGQGNEVLDWESQEHWQGAGTHGSGGAAAWQREV